MGSISENNATSSTDIVTIDISPLLSSTASQSSKDVVLDALRHSCTTTGFFQITGHGIPLALQQQVIQCAKTFFDLPLEQKNEVSLSKAFGQAYRGYEELKGQTASPDILPDLKEGFICDQEIPQTDPRAGKFLLGPNQWPAALKTQDFEAPLMDFRAQAVKVMETLLHAFAASLSDLLPADVFEGFTDGAAAPLRLLHYPVQETKDERQFGSKLRLHLFARPSPAGTLFSTNVIGAIAGAHADASALTVLLQQPGTIGLQIYAEAVQDWIPVPVIEDALVVNVGDMLQMWTGGYFVSAQHRVINSGKQDRYSIPIFYMGNLDAQFTPVEVNSKGSKNEHWSKVGMTDGSTTAGKFIMAKLQAVNSGDGSKALAGKA